MFFQRSHLLNPGRQYSNMYASVNSWPWPLPKRPCVRTAVITWLDSRSICKYSWRLRDTMCFGHQAPPLLSTFRRACCGPTFPISCALLAVICWSVMLPSSMPSAWLHVSVRVCVCVWIEGYVIFKTIFLKNHSIKISRALNIQPPFVLIFLPSVSNWRNKQTTLYK